MSTTLLFFFWQGAGPVAAAAVGPTVIQVVADESAIAIAGDVDRITVLDDDGTEVR